MSGPFGPNNPEEGRNDPTQQWQPAPGAGPTQQWGGQQHTPSQAQPTQQWGDQQQQWGQQPQQPQQPWGQTAPPQQQWSGTQPPQQQWGTQPPQDQWGQPQQQWGGQPQQQWGGQPQPQGGKRKGLIIGLAIGAVVVVGAVATLLVLLLSKDKLDQSAVQDGVKKVLTDSYGIQDVSDVSCPSGQEVKANETFSCDLKVSGEGKKVTVKITNDDGTYEVGRPN